jgi:hypothetical protein
MTEKGKRIVGKPWYLVFVGAGGEDAVEDAYLVIRNTYFLVQPQAMWS